MAILIEKNLKSKGIPIDKAYLRIKYTLDYSGKYIICHINPYYSKDSFLSNMYDNTIFIDGLDTYYEFSYDSSLNGDPLFYLHNKIKEVLTTDVTRIELATDPSTGELIRNKVELVDPSTGEIFLIDGDPSIMVVVVKPRFADPNEISFVDLE